MKNVIYGLCYALLLTTLCFLPTTSQAEKCEEDAAAVQVIKACHLLIGTGFLEPNCPVSSLPIEIDRTTGLAYVTARVYATHLTPSTALGGGYVLPTGTPEIYMRLTYSVNATSVPVIVGPFQAFGYDSSYQPTTDPLYHSDIAVTLDFSTYLCKDIRNEDPTITSDLQMELLRENKGTPGIYSMYPIHDYTGLGDIFTCSTFIETCADCSNPDCATLLDPVYNEELCFDCEGTDLGDTGFQRKGNTRSVASDWESDFMPNPFNDEVNLKVDTGDQLELEMEIYDAVGQLVQRQQFSWGTGSGQETISTADLSPGVYYFQLRDGQKTVTHKLVKLIP
ncbi:MAG: T9SS type A sorting domain-containing protein [Bacteroidota bacterium]